MSRQKRGLEKEHELAKDVFDITNGRIIPLRSGWSGNQAVPSPDLLIPFDGTLRALELKTTGKNKLTVTPEDIEDIQYWTVNMTEVPTYPSLGVKFNRRQLYVARLKRVSNPRICFERFVEECPFEAWVTDGGNLKIPKPNTDDWNSMRAVDSDTPDGDALIEALEKENTDQPSVTEIIRTMNGFSFQKS